MSIPMLRKTLSPTRSGDGSWFTEADLATNAAAVVEHAALTGRASVVASDERALLIITIPTTDLPTLD